MQFVRWTGSAAVRATTLLLAFSMASLVCAIPSQAWTFKTLHKFNGGAEGYGPGGLLWDAANGNLYGVATYGGVVCHDDRYGSGCGVLFQLTPDGAETVLHTFGGGKDGMYPQGGLAKDDAGNIYGTTIEGGNLGTIFKLTPDGSYTVLHAFQGGDDGQAPGTRLLWDGATQELYGTALSTAFKITPDGKYSALHQFASYPYLAMDGHGHVYGVTTGGGDERCNCGTAFALSPQGDETVLYAFTRKSLGSPQGAPVVDARGNLYGAGYGRGMSGSIFRLNRKDEFKVLHRFKGTGEYQPWGELVLDGTGSIYGTTGSCYPYGYGHCAIFQNQGKDNFQVLYTFPDQVVSYGGLIADPAGNLYGATYVANQSHSEVFELVK